MSADAKRSMYILANVNLAIWAISMIAVIFLAQDAPTVKKIVPILGGGTAVGIGLIATISKSS